MCIHLSRAALVAMALSVCGCCDFGDFPWCEDNACDSSGTASFSVQLEDNRGCDFQDDLHWSVTYTDKNSNDTTQQGDLSYHSSDTVSVSEARDGTLNCKVDYINVIIDDGCHPGTHYIFPFNDIVKDGQLIEVTIESDGHATWRIANPTGSIVSSVDRATGCNCLGRMTASGGDSQSKSDSSSAGNGGNKLAPDSGAGKATPSVNRDRERTGR